MTKNWRARHWLVAIVLICLLILVLAGSTGAADGVRIVFSGILHLLSTIITQLLNLISQLVNKIGR